MSRSTSAPEELVVTVNDLARGGAGVARAETGEVVFIPFTMPGDTVRVRVVKRKKRYLHAKLIEIVKKAPDRIEPRCPAFGTCGGCQWQHVPYETQWKTKVSGVSQALRRVAVELRDPPEEIPATKIWEYRNRIQLHGRGRKLGFHGEGGRELVPVDRCDLAREEVNARWEEARDMGERMAGKFKVELEHVEGTRVRMIWDSPHGALGFRQVHDEQNERLQAWVSAHLSGAEELFDLYGGDGNLSRGLSSRYARIDVVDTGAPLSGGKDCPATLHFSQKDVLAWLQEELKAGRDLDGSRQAILDPPRRGMNAEGDSIAKSLRILNVQDLILVSCDPDAFARDASALLRHGWEFSKVAVLDLFPQTKHVETLGKFCRTDPSKSSSD